jgi:prostaglandin-endoperoxide synthase 2
MTSWSQFKLLLRREGSFSNFFSNWSRANFKPVWDVLNRFGFTSDFYLVLLLWMNRKRLPRIPIMSAKVDYPTLETLYDESRTTYTRLLPRKKNFVDRLPPVEEVADLFRRNGKFKREVNRRSSLIFPYYAQWFSHQFFNTKMDPKESASTQVPVGFNLSQLYGSLADEQRLREKQGGRMRMQVINGEEYPPLIDNPFQQQFPSKNGKIFDIANVPFNQLPGVAAMQTIMLRNHNRNARIIAEANPRMDDEELFQKAKLVSLAQVLKVTMEDYVNNHILSTHVRIRCRPQVVGSFFWNRIVARSFYPCNTISMEFNILYRWHQLIPDTIQLIRNFDPARPPASLDGVAVDEIHPFSDAQQITDRGVEVFLGSASLQPAGKLTLFNTNDEIVEMVIKPGLRRMRVLELASYNDYRELFGLRRMEKFEDICDDPEIVEGLRRVYKGNIDDVEYYPGIFAEEKLWGGIHGAILALSGVSCTYAGIFSSRLLLPHVYKPSTFSEAGMKIIEETTLLQQLVGWNTKLKSLSWKVE